MLYLLWCVYRFFRNFRLSANNLLFYYDLLAVFDFDHAFAVDGHGHLPTEVMFAMCLKAYR